MLLLNHFIITEEIYSVVEETVLVLDPLTALNERKEEEKQSYQNLLRGLEYFMAVMCFGSCR